jgi:hypothetical protein
MRASPDAREVPLLDDDVNTLGPPGSQVLARTTRDELARVTIEDWLTRLRFGRILGWP